jgi:hypothetical protein
MTETQKMNKYKLAAFSNALPGRDDDYRDWYVNQHLPDVLALSGFTAGQFFRVIDPGNGAVAPRWAYFAVYDMAGEDVSVPIGELMAARETDRLKLTTSIDTSKVFLAAWEAITPWINAGDANTEQAQQRPEDARFRYVGVSNAVAGRDAEYNTWYNNQHLGDVLSVPGFVGAQRFRSVHLGNAPAPAWNYLAVYALNQPQAALAEEQARVGRQEMPVSDALDRSNVVMSLFEALTPKTLARIP